MIYKLIGTAIIVIAFYLLSAAQKPDLNIKRDGTEKPSLFPLLSGANFWGHWALKNEMDWKNNEGDFVNNPACSHFPGNKYYTGDD